MPWNYDNPEGFIEVTPENQFTQLSEHFSLYSFITHDQADIWPKYVVLREELLDKLELVLQIVAATGVPAGHVEVLSGFRHPHYNSLGAVEGNMAQHSRHQFGDAADIIIDDNKDGRMDDLNRDGRVDVADADVIQRAVEKVELRYPSLSSESCVPRYRSAGSFDTSTCAANGRAGRTARARAAPNAGGRVERAARAAHRRCRRCQADVPWPRYARHPLVA